MKPRDWAAADTVRGDRCSGALLRCARIRTCRSSRRTLLLPSASRSRDHLSVRQSHRPPTPTFRSRSFVGVIDVPFHPEFGAAHGFAFQRIAGELARTCSLLCSSSLSRRSWVLLLIVAAFAACATLPHVASAHSIPGCKGFSNAPRDHRIPVFLCYCSLLAGDYRDFTASVLLTVVHSR